MNCGLAYKHAYVKCVFWSWETDNCIKTVVISAQDKR